MSLFGGRVRDLEREGYKEGREGWEGVTGEERRRMEEDWSDREGIGEEDKWKRIGREKDWNERDGIETV